MDYTPSNMFGDTMSGGTTSPVEVATRWEAYKDALTETHKKSASGNYRFHYKGKILTKSVGGQLASRVEAITKALTPDQLSALGSDLDAMKAIVAADVEKDWSLFNPDSAGLVPFDLEGPAKLLVPRMTPLRNRIPRTKGQGTADIVKRITGWSNSGVGGVADQMAWFSSEAASTAFGPISLRRPAKITYTAGDKTIKYMEQGLSDSVTLLAELAGRGYQDIRSLSQTALLWASLGAEERAILYGRGTSGNGYAGVVAAPVISGATATTGGTIAAGTYQITVTANAGGGQTVLSNRVAQVTTGATSTITVTVATEPTGALNYNLYVSQAGGGAGSETFQGIFSGNSVTITAPPSAGGVAASTIVADTTANALAYDGLLTVQADPTQSGYVKRVNGSIAALGDKPWQDAFLALYGGAINPGGAGFGNKLLADPDEIWIDGQSRNSLGQWVKTTASTVSYRIVLQEAGGADGAMVGFAVGGIVNQTTGRMSNLIVHPYMPVGNSLLRSSTLPAPVPDSNIEATAVIRNVQDYMSIDWPVIQMAYDSSTYWLGAMVHYAPAWSGMLIGLQP